MTAANLMPEYVTPADLAAHLGVSERTLKERARELGACRIIGKRMFFTGDDVTVILEDARPCQSKSTSVEKSGTMPGQSREIGYVEARERLTKPSRNKSPHKKKMQSGNVVLMEKARG